MSNSSDEGEKDRLTSEEFVDLIPHLPFANILEIEFFSGGWKRLIVSADTSKRLYRCNLCKLILSGPKSVFSHINGKKHIGNMSNKHFFYHSEYTFSKSQLCSPEITGTKNKLHESSKEENTVLLKNSVNLQKLSVVKAAAINESKGITNQNKPIPNSNGKSVTETEKLPLINEPSNQIILKNAQVFLSETIGKQTGKEIIEKTTTETCQNSKVEPKNSISGSPPNQTLELRFGKLTESIKNHDTNSDYNVRKISIRSSDQLLQTDMSNKTNNNSSEKNCRLHISQNEGVNSVNEGKNQCVLKAPTISDVSDKNFKIEVLNASDQTIKKRATKGNQCSNVTDRMCTSETSINDPKTQNNLVNASNNTNKECTKSKVLVSKSEEKCFSKQVKKHEKCPLASLGGMNSDNLSLTLDRERSRKLVKNPLAALKKNSIVANNESNELENQSVGEDVIIIEDNDDVNYPAKRNVNESLQESEQNISLLASSETTANQTRNKSTVIPRSNLVLIPTGDKISSAKNSKKSGEPVFAVRSLTDTTINDEICGFVGVEYVIKICRPGIPPKYECGLCELILDGNTMQNHLLGYNHRLKFCEKHFPTAIQQFRQYIVNVAADEHYKVMIPVLQKLSVAIEEHHGRSLPFDCDERRYNLERHRVLTEVFARRHASEQQGPTFTHVVDAKQVDEFILQKDATKQQITQNKMIFDRAGEGNWANQTTHQEIQRRPYKFPSNFNHNIIPYAARPMQASDIHPPARENTYLDDETHKRMVDDFLKANKSNFIPHNSSRSNLNEREYRRHSLKRSHSPSRTNIISNKDLLNNWSRYCRLVDTKLKSLEEKFQQYRANPECHPFYKDEWLKFWHRRKSELMAIGKDYRTYDYQPDWVPFFNNRVNELYIKAFEKLKIKAREELSLSMTNDYLRDPKYFVHVKTNDYGFVKKKVLPPPIATHMNMSQKQISLPLNNLNGDEKTGPFFTTTRFIESFESKTKIIPSEIQMRDEPPPTVVSVLRLLTALEEYLGSLGPKIVDLLSKALQVEKTHQGRAHVLLTEENYTLLETAMEKFKGLVIAGILDSPKERALKKAISKVNALLDYTKEVKEKHQVFKRNERERNDLESNSTAVSSIKMVTEKSPPDINEKLKQALQSVSNANDISKVIHLIEEKIAATLKAQGHTDVDRAHLEQLAAVCVLLEKKKQEAGNIGSRELITYQPIFQQPLSDALKKIVGTLPLNTTEVGSNKQIEHITQITSSMSGAGRIDLHCKRNVGMQHLNPNSTSNVQLKSFTPIYSGNPHGNFSNLCSKNDNQIRMADDPDANSQLQPWQQKQHKCVPSLYGWSRNLNRPWSANKEAPSTSGINSQLTDYQNNFGQKPAFLGKSRYN